jgi:hypothetical protein
MSDRFDSSIKLEFNEIKNNIKTSGDAFLINNKTSSIIINKIYVTFGEVIDLENRESVQRSVNFILNTSRKRYETRHSLDLWDVDMDEIVNTRMTRITRFYIFKVISGYIKEISLVYPNN